MLRFLLDEHVPSALWAALLLAPDLDVVRVQDVGLRTADDTTVFDWAARAGRVVLSEDRNTMIGDAHARVAAGQPFAGLAVIRRRASVGRLVDDIRVLAGVHTLDDMATLVVHLPL